MKFIKKTSNFILRLKEGVKKWTGGHKKMGKEAGEEK